MFTNLDGSLAVYIRLAFRIAFLILFLYIGVIAAQCKKLAIKLALLRHGKVPVSHAAGWLRGSQVLWPLWHLRRIPDPKWWILMVFIAMLAGTADLATNIITQVTHYSACPFGVGLVMNPERSDWMEYPKINSRTAFVAGNAQYSSVQAGCLAGIYWKADSNPDFCASWLDFIGNWTCVANGPDVTYQYGTMTVQNISDDLVSRGLLYAASDNDTNFQPFSQYDGPNSDEPYNFNELVLWSSSEPDGSDQPWNVLASVDTTPQYSDEKIMHNMACELAASPSIYSIPPYPDTYVDTYLFSVQAAISSRFALSQWITMLQTYMYDGYASSIIGSDNVSLPPEFWLGWYLNNMIMVAGSGDNMTAPAPASFPTEGCNVLRVKIPAGIIFLLALTVVVSASLTAFIAVLWLRVRRFGAARKQAENAPVDIWSWMAQAVAEADVKPDGTVDVVRPRDLRDWKIALSETSMLRIEKREAHGQPLLTEIHVEPKNEVGWVSSV